MNKRARDDFARLIASHDPLDSAHEGSSYCGYCLALKSYWREYWGKA
jgi:hypothetical protein